jgi:cytochrome c oxidase cbb3-type subunit 3
MTKEKLPSEQVNDDYEYDTLTNDRLLKDHEYDGIRELDNSPPSWFNLLFLGTIVFAILYLYILWMFQPAALVQSKEYQNELAKAQFTGSANPAPRAIKMVLLNDEESLQSGKQVFNSVCAVCHLADGGGLVGPNLTDDYWIHGNSVKDLFTVITEGVIEKGMIPYYDQLSHQQRLELTGYILTELVGSEPASPKEPEGELIE